MKSLEVSKITAALEEMCLQAATELTPDMSEALIKCAKGETHPRGKWALDRLMENLEIARETKIPICQDTGMAVVFLELGQDLHLIGGDVNGAVCQGVRQGYLNGRLRCSVVSDPLLRVNTNDNTPPIIYTDIVPGDKLKITLAPKGFGSENTSRVFMLKPADGVEGVKAAVLQTVEDAGPNACPPLVVGVGIGGVFDKCAQLAKRALLRDIGAPSPLPHIADLEKELLESINALGIGPAGLGGECTALAVNVETYPTHMAGLPVAVNICCHVNRHAVRILEGKD